jgi:hypothetical protein
MDDRNASARVVYVSFPSLLLGIGLNVARHL